MSINWKKSIFVVCDIIIAGYLVLAVTAFNRPDTQGLCCTEVTTDIKTGLVEGFLTDDDVKRILKREGIYPLSRQMDDINVRQIEEVLGRSPFVERVECYKAQAGRVCIQLWQRVPVAHVMSDKGDSYYVDTHGNVMPETRYAADLMVVTGHINRKYAGKVLAPVAYRILQDSFWKNQVVQINVLSDGSMEVVPRVGNHIAYLGMPVDVEAKLERLRKFYLYGLNKAGWNKYAYVSVEFDNQIICKREKVKR